MEHYEWHQFISWEDGVGCFRCLWTAQQHGVLQVGVSLNVTHLEIHGVEQWTFQTSRASIKWRKILFTTVGWRIHNLHPASPSQFLSVLFSITISSINFPFLPYCVSFWSWCIFPRAHINPRLGHFAFDTE